MNEQEFSKKRAFIIRLGKALHRCGTPAYRLEGHLTNVAEHLGVRGNFLVSPTTLTFVMSAFGSDTSHSEEPLEHNHIARVKPGDIDLGALAQCDELVNQLISGQIALQEAIVRLAEIQSQPPAYGPILTGIAFCASAGAFAMLMEASWLDVMWSCALGAVVYLLVFWSERSVRVGEMLEPLAAMVCAFLGCAAAVFLPAINIPVTVLSGIIIFIPGLALTIGLAELAARDLISGTARIMDATMLLFKLYFGAILGFTLGRAMFGESSYLPAEPVNQWAHFAAVPILSMCLVIVFRARLKDAPWGLLAGIIAYAVAEVAMIYFSRDVGMFFGALAVGIYANIYARWMNAPASIVMLQGIVILVPGSKAYIGLNAAVSGEVLLNQQSLGSQIFLIFMSLIAGLIFANVIVPRRRGI
ncbi:MAG: threonine/serine exporter family protein [Gammaproteobacteria bacterium]|nr:threonine/serine exporter family protein [Gammaproteobacteria bacterium]